MSEIKRKFNYRAFFSLTLVISGIGLPITGIANHYHQFDPMRSARHAWMAGHNCLGFLFTLAVIGHIVLNRRALWNYIKGFSRDNFRLSRETIWACALVGVFMFFIVGHAFHVE